jgi:hypothetical protein
MFFCKLGRVLAWIGLVGGVLRLAMGFSVASIDDPTQRADAVARYLGNSALTTGEHIDRMILFILGAIVLGVLSEIGLMRSRAREPGP